MASHLKRVLLTALLSLVVLMGDVKPVLAKKGDKDKQLAKMLEESVRELKEKMKEQEDKVKEQDEKMKEQEKKIKTLEECKACSKIKALNETLNELQEKIDSKPECQNYQSLTSADRKITYGAGNECDDGLGPGWFRFQGAAGTRMPTSCPPFVKCNTQATGWLNGEHPTVAEGRVTRQACFSFVPGCCTYSTNIQVRNCGSFYVYYLNGLPEGVGCSVRYCSTD